MKLKEISWSKNGIAILLTFLFFFIYALISLVNHYFYRTSAWDLGIYEQMIFHYSHFKKDTNTVMQPTFDNVLSDHFCLLPILFSPFYWIFKSYTMLIAQILGVLFGGWGVYKYALLKNTSGKTTLFAGLSMLHFLSIWGIFSALAYDYHDNVLASAFVPWLFVYAHQKKWAPTLLFLVLILISKENMALWSVCLCFGLFLKEYIEEKRISYSLLLMSFLSAVYFVLVIKVIIPSIANDQREYLHFHYKVLGENFGEAFKNVLSDPFRYFTYLFSNHTNNTSLNQIKWTSWEFFLLSGGILLFRKPIFLFMLLPVFFQKFFNDDVLKWSISYQYSVEFAPILAIGVLENIESIKIKYPKMGMVLYFVVIVFTMKYTYSSITEPYAFSAVNTDIFSKKHYKPDIDRKEVQEVFAMIPKDASLTTESRFLPYLAFRDKIYPLPFVLDAEYMLLSPFDFEDVAYGNGDFHKQIFAYLQDGWRIIHKDQLILLKKDTTQKEKFSLDQYKNPSFSKKIDFEGAEYQNEPNITSEFKYEGEKACLVTESMMYSKDLKVKYNLIPNAKQSFIKAKFKIYLTDSASISKPTFVYTSNNEKDKNFGYCAIDLNRQKTLTLREWNTVEVFYLIPPKKEPDDEFMMFIWMSGIGKVYVDNFEVEAFAF